jgi:hypothetical protein
MKNSIWLPSTIVLAVLSATGCGRDAASSQHDDLVGAWRSQVRFTSGALAEVKDLEFMYVFNAGGTLTESSNYDGAPPVPPAYGTWQRSGPHQFEARYAFYATKAPANFEDIAKGGSWSPAGHGELTEKITLSADGNSYTSTVSYAAFDPSGAPADDHGEATGAATRMGL